MKHTHRILRPTDYKRARWKNGLGWTDQIAISPENADLKKADFDWRVSTARIEQSADFSPFADHDRVLVVVEGDGVRLLHTFEEGEPQETVELPANEPYEFPGDIPTRCELMNGPIQDLSVFVRKGVVFAEVRTESIQDDLPFQWQTEGRTGLVFVTDGSVDIDGAPLSKGETLRIDFKQGAEPLTLTASEARVLLIQIN